MLTILNTIGLKTKIIVLVTSVVIASFVAMIWLITQTTIGMAKRHAFSLAHEIADRYRDEISTDLQEARVTSQTLAAVFEALRDNDLTNRGIMNAILKHTLAKNEYITAFSVIYEPNALDGQDKLFAGVKPYGTGGRYAPYWHKLNGGITAETIHDIDIVPWYQIPKATKHEYITDPYLYRINGRELLVTSLVSPILDHGDCDFIGIVASDIVLDKLQKMISRGSPYGQGGFVAVFTNSGVVATHPDRTLIGKDYLEIQVGDMLATDAATVAKAARSLRAFHDAHPVAAKWSKDELEKSREIEEEIEKLDKLAADFAPSKAALSIPPLFIAKELLKADPVLLRNSENALKAIATGATWASATDRLYTVFTPVRFSDVTKPWSVAVSIPMANILEDAHAIRNKTILLSSMTIIVIAAILWLIANRITQPILILSQAARRLTEGKFDAKLPSIRNGDEIGSLVNAFGVMSEKISDQVRISNSYAQELREKNENLKQLNILNDEFLANTSHELRTPLNGIIGIAESMIDGAVGEMTGAQKYNLAVIANSGKSLAQLVDDIIDFTKLKNREIILHKQPVDLETEVDMVLSLIQPTAGGAQIALVNELDKNLPPLDADETRIRQILYNIIDNAVKFTKQGSVRVRAHVDGLMAVISIADTGIGIPKEKLAAIFEWFEQMDDSVSRAHGGTGLGLPITKNLIELHGGAVEVTSELGRGTVFTFTMPLSDQAVASSRDTAEVTKIIDIDTFPSEEFKSVSPPGNRRILIVDDEAINVQVLSNLLSIHHFSVSKAFNGEEALALIEKGAEFDLVLLDIMMPKMSGYEVCKRLREKFSLFQLPVLMLTAKNQIGDLVLGFRSGANDYVQKPFDKEELLMRITTLLQLKHSVSDALENAQKFENEKRKRQAEESLREIAKALTSTLRLDEVLDEVLKAMVRFVPFTTSAVLLREGDGFTVKLQTGFAIPNERISAADPFLRQIIAEKRVVTWTAESALFKVQSAEDAALFGLPIICHDELLGVIVFTCLKREFSSELPGELLLILAGQVGVAIQNALLFEKVSSMATTDALTGLYNRRHFFELADKEFARFKRYGGVPMSLFMLDIDYFKQINDTFGHAAGDKVLARVAAILLETLRANDISGRYGGEEFAVILPGTPVKTAEKIAERLRQVIAGSVTDTEAGLIRCTVSIGVSAAGARGLMVALAAADKALYAAKEGGRNKVEVNATDGLNG